MHVLESEETLRRKTKYVAQKRLGGVFVWHLGADDVDGSCKNTHYLLTDMTMKALHHFRCKEQPSDYCSEQGTVGTTADADDDENF